MFSSLLSDPNPDDPLDIRAANIYNKDKKEFLKFKQGIEEVNKIELVVSEKKTTPDLSQRQQNPSELFNDRCSDSASVQVGLMYGSRRI